MQNKENIIVIGYPKSGNTWLARLIAELTNSQIDTVGNNDLINGADNYENRTGKYKIKKIHNTLDIKEIQCSKFVYIIRDPRAVFVSGFFHKHRDIDEDLIIDNFLYRLFFNYEIIKLNKGWSSNLRAKINIFKKYLLLKKYNRKITIKELSSPPIGIDSWSAHVMYWQREESVLIVKYEDLLEDTERELIIILEYLNIQISKNKIKTVIENQNFNSRKKDFLEKGDKKNAKFLRSGKNDNWKKFLSIKQQKKIVKKHKKVMINYGYLEV